MAKNLGCINWLGGVTSDGYGNVTINGRQTTAHRAEWIKHFGEIPADMFVLHTCDNPRCINIRHLWLGTHTDNMRDMRAKGRNVSGHTKLTQAQVEEIRNIWKDGTHKQTEIAKMFNIGKSTVSTIISRKLSYSKDLI